MPTVGCGSQNRLPFGGVRPPECAEPSAHREWIRTVYCGREPESRVLGVCGWKGRFGKPRVGGFAARQPGQSSRGLMDYIPPVRTIRSPTEPASVALELCWCFLLPGEKLVSDWSVTFLSSCFPKCGKNQTQIICTKLVNFNQVVEESKNLKQPKYCPFFFPVRLCFLTFLRKFCWKPGSRWQMWQSGT